MVHEIKMSTKIVYTYKRKVSLLTSLLLLLLVFGTLVIYRQPSEPYIGSSPVASGVIDSKVTLVIASQKQDDTGWLHSSFPAWNKMIYVTDDPDAPLAVPANRGREGMAYLT